MRSELLRFQQPISPYRLATVLSDPEVEHTEKVGMDVDFEELEDVIQKLMNETTQRSAWDGELAEPLHRALKMLPRRAVTDMRLWHWLCIVRFGDFVWHRWYGRVPERPEDALTPSLSERFLGSRSLRGVSRNALGRLFWCAETLYSAEHGYYYVTEALSNQDFYQAIFERKFGLYTPAARACLDGLRTASEGERREATKRLNHYLTTIILETLSDSDIRELLDR